jgi:hypothetical protein
MKVGPKAGTKYNVARSANIENPTEVYKDGSGGTGSRKGRTTNHAATGTMEPSKIVGSGRGASAALLMVPAMYVVFKQLKCLRSLQALSLVEWVGLCRGLK